MGFPAVSPQIGGQSSQRRLLWPSLVLVTTCLGSSGVLAERSRGVQFPELAILVVMER